MLKQEQKAAALKAAGYAQDKYGKWGRPLPQEGSNPLDVRLDPKAPSWHNLDDAFDCIREEQLAALEKRVARLEAAAGHESQSAKPSAPPTAPAAKRAPLPGKAPA